MAEAVPRHVDVCTDVRGMSAEALLSRLHKVRRTGPGKWNACCPAHDDRAPSLSIRELDDGRILLHDFGGCDVQDIVSAIGFDLSALFPPLPAPVDGNRPERRPWIPADAFEAVRLEVIVVGLIAADLHKGKTVSDSDFDRLLVAADRLNDIGNAAYGRR